MNIAKNMPKQDLIQNYQTLYSFQALQQISGKGQRQNTWLSPKGNVYITYVFKFNIQHMYCITQLASLAVLKALRQYIKSLDQKQNLNLGEKVYQDITLKWINDVFFNNKKICGILVESEICGQNPYIILGIGVNISHSPLNISTCLQDELIKYADKKVELNIKDYVDILSENLLKLIDLTQKEGFKAIRNEISENLEFKNQQVKIYDEKLENVLNQGEFKEINDYGHAILIDQEGNNTAIIDGRMRL